MPERERRRESMCEGELTLLNGDRAAASAPASDRFTKQTENVGGDVKQ